MAQQSSETQAASDIITTQRLLLRPLRSSDGDSVFAIRSDPRVLYWTTPDTREKCDEWLKTRLESPKTIIHTVSLLDEEDQVIGLTGAHTIPELGYTFHPSSWDKGYGTESLKAWIKWYWNKFPDGHPTLDEEENQYLKALTGKENEASMNVMKKCGFKWYAEKELSEEDKAPREKGMRVVLQEFRVQRPHTS